MGIRFVIAGGVIAGGMFVSGIFAFADTVNELKNKINDRGSEIEKLEQEIAQYQNQLDEIGQEKTTLENEIKRIDLTRQKIAADIRVTENRVDATSLNIEKLNIEIGDTEGRIAQNTEAMKQALRKIQVVEDLSMVELVLASDKLSTFWSDVEQLERIRRNISDQVDDLIELKSNLEEDRAELAAEKENLLDLREELSGQKQVADNNKRRKDELLTQTENKEADYQEILEEKRRLKEEFERELADLESQLRIAIDPSSLPPVGSGILAWPLDSVKITQYFGNTEFAQGGAYNGNGHNGVDFRASVGTRVKAAASGTVAGVGNTDQYPGCYSYGKWVLIKHNNGLSTLYAHLDVISARKGQQIDTGDAIGFSGNTGYSTGPHLHFGVYASEGVRIVRLGDIKKITNCGNAHIPVAPLNAYLNPLDYL